MNNLVIGNTSQLSYFFPDDYIKISSRNIDMNYLKNNKWDRVYITFAEHRTFDDESSFVDVNYTYTSEIIESLWKNSNKIIVYGTCELWNLYTGEISLNDEFRYKYDNDYVLSKELLINRIKNNRVNGIWDNVIIIYPFNFNSTFRKPGFLFSKVFDSIINKTKIEIGDIYFYRDLIHTKYVVDKSIKAEEDEMIGSGRLVFINDFLRDLYKYFDMNYDDYVIEKTDNKSKHYDKIFYSECKKVYPYHRLLQDTVDDITSRKKIKRENILYDWCVNDFSELDKKEMDDIFNQSMKSVWDELVDKIISYDMSFMNVINIESNLNIMKYNKEVYDYKIEEDKIYIDPVPRFFGKCIKIIK